MTLEELKSKINALLDDYSKDNPMVTFNTATELAEKPARTDGKRAIRTKSTGDRVYVVDDNAKTKAWVTSPEILSKLGFEMADVQDVEDSSLLGYTMQPSVYKVDG